MAMRTIIGFNTVAAAVLLMCGCTDPDQQRPADTASDQQIGEADPTASSPQYAKPGKQRTTIDPATVLTWVPKRDKPALRDWEQKLDAGLSQAVRAKPEVKTKQGDEPLQVTVIAHDEADVAALRLSIETAGGELRSIFQNRLYINLPPHAIETLARQDKVWSMQIDQPAVAPQATPEQPAVPASANTAAQPRDASDTSETQNLRSEP